MWTGQGVFAPSAADEYDPEKGYDVFFEPDDKVSITQAFELFRNRYEGTQFDLSQTENDYYLGINNQMVGCADIIQVFDDVPEEMSSVLWATPANPTASPFIPIPVLCSCIPEEYSTDNIDDAYIKDSVQFDFAKLNNTVVQRRTLYGDSIRQYWEGMEAVSTSDVTDSVRGKWKEGYEASVDDAVKTADYYLAEIVTAADKNCNRLLNELEWYIFRNGVRKSTVPDDELEPFECTFDAVSCARANGWDTSVKDGVFVATKDDKKI